MFFTFFLFHLFVNLQKRRASQKMSDVYDTFDKENDFIDEYLTKVDNCRNRKSSFFGDKGVVNLQRSLTDLFGAGSETTTTEILFCFLYMIKFPEIQVRVGNTDFQIIFSFFPFFSK